jgi:hypothetical protein
MDNVNHETLQECDSVGIRLMLRLPGIIHLSSDGCNYLWCHMKRNAATFVNSRSVILFQKCTFDNTSPVWQISKNIRQTYAKRSRERCITGWSDDVGNSRSSLPSVPLRKSLGATNELCSEGAKSSTGGGGGPLRAPRGM